MISRNDLLEELKLIDSHLNRKMELIAVGGTAMTLLNLKESTKDVDFCTDTKEDETILRKAISEVGGEFRIDIFKEGYIFSVQLPEDYAKKSKQIEGNFKHLSLKTLHPVDIVMTKIDRLSARDQDDIEAIIKSKRIRKEALKKRFKEVATSIPGRQSNFEYNFNYIIKNFF